MDKKKDTVVLTDDQGKEVEFEHIDTIEMNDNCYVILLPVEDPDEGVVILKFDDKSDEELLIGIEDDEEAQAVLDRYFELLDEAEEEEDKTEK